MSFIENLLGQIGGGGAPALIATMLGKTNMGDLGGIVSQLQQGGLGSQVASWLGNGQNLPVSPDQLRSALGNEQVQQIAQHLGLPIDKALAMLSQHLPDMVDKASPNGQLQDGS